MHLSRILERNMINSFSPSNNAKIFLRNNIYIDIKPFDTEIYINRCKIQGAMSNIFNVELKNGKQFMGTLKSFDIHINTVLADAEEHVEGELKRKMGTVFIRGDTIILISPA